MGARHPAGIVIDRDLAATPLPLITDAWAATYGDPQRLPRARADRADAPPPALISVTVAELNGCDYTLSVAVGIA